MQNSKLKEGMMYGKSFGYLCAVLVSLVVGSCAAPTVIDSTVRSSVVAGASSHTSDESTTGYYTGVVRVKFASPYRIRLRDGYLVDLDGQASIAALRALMAVTARGEWQPVYVDEAAMDALRANGQANSDKVLPDLNNYFYYYPPNNWDEDSALAVIEQSPLVLRSMRVPVPFPVDAPDHYLNPGGVSGNLAADPYQRYLDPAPDGIDARYAWLGTGGIAEDMRICDIELDYNPYHSDISEVTLLGPSFTVAGQDDNHGTAVLGILGGRDDGIGITGIAFGASLYFSHWLYTQSSTTNGFLPSLYLDRAVTRCTAALDAGDVILLEAQIVGPNRPDGLPSTDQTGLVPVSWDEATYDVIQLAVANGIIVVEAAGNGAENLDDAAYNTGHAPFLTSNDSGSFIVGAGKSPYWPTGVRGAHDYSNYGVTVDLQGWGDSIVTTGYGDLFPGGTTPDPAQINQWYKRAFGGTSGASPMVAASAAIVQNTNKHLHGGAVMSPNTVKNLLRTTGTAQTGAKNIGPMPNLRGAIEQLMADAGAGIADVVEPVVSPASGIYAMPIQVEIDYGSAAQNQNNTLLRYTLDGSEPTIDSFIFIPEHADSIYLNYGAALNVKAFQRDAATGRYFPSDTVNEIYVSSTPKVEAPTIVPGAGTYEQGTLISMFTNTPGATIRYRTDGRVPSFFYPGTLYSGPIALSVGTHEVVARGYKDGYYKSDATSSGEIVITPVALTPPTIYPGTGSYNGEVTAYIGSSILGSQLRYTVDGTDPTANSPLFSEPFVFTQTTTLRARTYLDGYEPSVVSSATYFINHQAQNPSITPNGGEFTGSVQVTLSAPDAGATIRYTTNGAQPTSYSTAYSGPFTLGVGTHTVKARAFLPGALASETVQATFTVYDPNLEKVAAPVFNPGGGNHTGSVTVTITSATEDATIRYTTDGSIPDNSSTLYTQPLVLAASPDTYIFRAKAFKTGMAESNFTPATFNVFTPQGTVNTPIIVPESGTYTDTLQVTISITKANNFANPLIYHTTNGADPVVPPNTPGKSTPYSFNLSKSATVKALGAQLGYHNSEVAQQEYILQCAAPSMTPGGTYTTSVSVSISTSTPNATIRYTTDGSEPDASSLQYTTPFTVGIGATTVKAKCFRTNFEGSPTVSEVYVVSDAPTAPVILTQPADQNKQVGDTAVFSVTVANVNPETVMFQWQFQGVDLASETDLILELHDVQPDHAGAYRIVVQDTGGNVTSNEAQLVVEEEPIEGLEATSNAPTLLGEPTSFFASVSGGTNISYTWNFGNGSIGNGATVSHTYVISGVYTAVVTATNGLDSPAVSAAAQSMMTATTVVSVTETAIAIDGLSASNDGPTILGDTTAFSATVSAGTSVEYHWDFGDGQEGSGLKTSHTYTRTGIFTATVTASNTLNSQQAATVVEIVADTQPLAGLTATNDSPNVLGSPTFLYATLETGSNVTFDWSFGDGTVGSGSTVSHSYPTAGTFTAIVTATNPLTALVASTVVTISETDLPITNLELEGENLAEVGEPLQFRAQSDGTAVTYMWDFGDGTTDTGATVSHVFTRTGMFSVTVVASNSAGSSVEAMTVTVQQTEIAISGLLANNDGPTELGNVTQLDAVIAEGTNVTFTWDFGDSSGQGTGALVNHLYKAAGTYTAIVTATNGLNSESAQTVVTVLAPSEEEEETIEYLYLPRIENSP